MTKEFRIVIVWNDIVCRN